MLTYGDGVGDVDIDRLLKFHRGHGKIATLTAVRPTGRFGALDIDDNQSIRFFQEKPEGDSTWVNGGFFVFNSRVFEYLKGDDTILERDPMERLAADKQLIAYKHSGFWQPMDTLRDKNRLEELWQSGNAPWRMW
jgi:glucose-1-phosphate cytidylyltransferase